MRRANLWNQSVSRVELDQRAREARRRLERMEQQFLARAAVARFPSQTAPLSVQRRHFGQCVARKPAKGAAEQSAAFAHADHS